ncbi:unnamed protein product [Toxocara canis]|uniref:Transmembrane protein n=1 Tax=Toxocara canis TaxID=6265 RepID=A0A183UHJ4_TOXCA|nr:unnamed protein product [Toxocara canis]
MNKCMAMENGFFWVVAVPNARNYVENGKVRFDRVRPAGEVLAFERNPVAFVPPILLPNKILFEKLKKKNDRKEMSLADADDKENGAEVVELADAEERDYKEMVADRWHANWI